MSQPNQQQQQQNQNARTAEAVGQLAGSLLGAGLRLAASGERSRASFLGLSLLFYIYIRMLTWKTIQLCSVRILLPTPMRAVEWRGRNAVSHNPTKVGSRGCIHAPIKDIIKSNLIYLNLIFVLIRFFIRLYPPLPLCRHLDCPRRSRATYPQRRTVRNDSSARGSTNGSALFSDCLSDVCTHRSSAPPLHAIYFGLCLPSNCSPSAGRVPNRVVRRRHVGRGVGTEDADGRECKRRRTLRFQPGKGRERVCVCERERN